MQRSGAEPAEALALAEPARQPVQQHTKRNHQSDHGQQREEGERGPALAAQTHRPRRPRRAAAQPVIPPAPPLRRLDGQHQGDESDQHQAEHGQRGAIERGAEAHVDRAGESVEAHHRDCAEVADHVERHQQRAGRQRHPQLRQGHAQKRLPAALAQRAARLFESRIEVSQARPQHQQHVRVGEQRQHQPGAREAVELGQRIHAQRLQQPLERSRRSQGGDHRQPRDVGGHRQRYDGDRAPPARAGQIGALRQPRAGQGDQRGSGGHRDRQRDRVEQQPRGVVAQHIGPAVGVGGGRADDQVDQRNAGRGGGGHRQHPDDGDALNALKGAVDEQARRAGQREAAETQQCRPVTPPPHRRALTQRACCGFESA